MKNTFIILLILSLPLTTFAQNKKQFIAPDLTQEIFKVKELSITEAERQTLATAIGHFVKNTQDVLNLKNRDMACRLLGIALRLDPKNRTSIIINSKLKKGFYKQQLEPVSVGNPKLYAAMNLVIKKIEKSAKMDDKKLVTYLYSMLSDLDKNNDNAIFYIETLDKALTPNWTWAIQSEKHRAALNKMSQIVDNPKVKSKPAIGMGMATVRRNQSSIKGLVVYTLESGKMLGKTLDIIITFSRSRKMYFGFHRGKKIGKDMRDAHTESIRYVATKYPHCPIGNYVVSFGDKYSLKDGGSAGAAFTLTLLSIFEEFEVGQDVAITGDITVDGKIRKVGGVSEKIHGAFLDKCKLVCIPVSNIESFEDYIILNKYSYLKNIHVFSIVDIDAAKKIVRKKRSSEVNKAMADFDQLMTKINLINPHLTLNKEEVLAKLDGIVKSCPNYENARVLSLALKGKLRKTISMHSSLYKVMTISSPYLVFLKETVEQPYESSEYKEVVDNMGRVRRDRYGRALLKTVKVTKIAKLDSLKLLKREDFSKSLLDKTRNELNKLKMKVDPKARPLLLEILSFVSCVDSLAKSKKAGKRKKRFSLRKSIYYKKLIKLRVKILNSFKELTSDDDFLQKSLR